MLLFIFCLSCLVFKHFVFAVKLRTVLSQAPVKFLLQGYAKSNLITPSSKNQEFGFFWRLSVQSPLIGLYVPLTSSAAVSNALVSSSTRFRTFW